MLTPEELRIGVAVLVGAAIGEVHECRCGKTVDRRALHGLSCRLNKGRHSCQAALNDIIKRSSQKSGYASVLEPTGLDRDR